MAFQRLFSKRFLNSFKTNVSFERAIVSKAVRSPVVPHESLRCSLAVFPPPTNCILFWSDKAARVSYFSRRRTGSPRGTQRHQQQQRQFCSCDGAIISETSLEYVKKIMRAKLMEKVKTKLRNVAASSIQYSEFLQICIDTCENSDKGAEIAKLLDDSGIVLVLENSVLLRPNQAIERFIVNPIDLIELKKMKLEKMELEEMVKKKIKIDDKVKTQIRIEDYFGLGFCIVLIFGFVFNFPELISWNVMGDILYFIIVWWFVLGYLYFSRTHRDLSFRNLKSHRFRIKQKRLMKTYNFDVNRFNELCEYVSY